VLRLCACAEPSRVALEAAICVAQAFQSEIESLFVEESQLYELAAFPFAREISLSGRASRALTLADMERQMRMVAGALQRQVESLARLADVPVRRRVVRAAPVDALARACAETGPWNVVALAEAFQPGCAPALRELFQSVTGATGIVIAGPKAKRTTGPVTAVVEDTDRLSAILRAAERLAAVTGGGIELLAIAATGELVHELEGQARLLVARQDGVRIAGLVVHSGAEAAVAETLRRLHSGFVVAQFGGLVVPAEGDLKPLAAALECPLFLVR
jgi:hypothetical protein